MCRPVKNYLSVRDAHDALRLCGNAVIVGNEDNRISFRVELL